MDLMLFQRILGLSGKEQTKNVQLYCNKWYSYKNTAHLLYNTVAECLMCITISIVVL